MRHGFDKLKLIHRRSCIGLASLSTLLRNTKERQYLLNNLLSLGDTLECGRKKCMAAITKMILVLNFYLDCCLLSPQETFY